MTGSGSRHSDAWESPGFLLWHATLRWQRSMAEALEPLGLTHVQFVLLASTWWLCEHAGTDPMMTSQVARTLVSKGLLVREVDPDDGRAWRLRLTRAGTTLARRAVAAVEDADSAYFDQVPSRHRGGMLAALKELGGPRS